MSTIFWVILILLLVLFLIIFLIYFNIEDNNSSASTINEVEILSTIPVNTLLDIKTPSISSKRFPHLKNWFATNPTILTEKDGYTLIVRNVNYFTKNGCGVVITDDGINRSRNYFVKLNENFEILSSVEIKTFTNIEDCRLFKYRNRYWFSATYFPEDLKYISRICLCRLSDEIMDNFILVDYFLPFSVNGKKWEKNWLPFIQNDEIYLIQDHNSFLLSKVDFKEKRAIPIFNNEVDGISRFRGSASPIEYNNGYLYCVHEVEMQSRKKFYFHRLVWMTKSYEIKYISNPFYFEKKGIEFCCGMTWSIDSKELLFSVGIDDNIAKIFRFDRKSIDDILLHV